MPPFNSTCGGWPPGTSASMLTDPNSAGAKLVVARPAIVVDGRELPALSDAMIALRVHESVDEMPSCELTLGNRGSKDGRFGFRWFDRDVLDFGKALQVRIAG